MSSQRSKTIAAIATPQGYGGVGVIRISGDRSVAMARRLLRDGVSADFDPNRASFHYLINPETGATIDDAIITFFKAPHSFTGEDVIEIACHGSPVVLSEILRLLTSCGAELAQPGEFSMRAFLNQRMDLTQAEAIKDLIHAQTTHQARLAARQLRGEISKRLRPIKDGLVEMIVHFESSVEFVEDDLDPLNIELFLSRIDQFIEQLVALASSYRLGKLIRSGIKLALIGRPNVGKSSLFNALLGRERAIVTHLPGTTRDTLNESFIINGVPVDLIDTAGIRETEDIVEQIGVERTKTAISEADLIIAVIESTSILPVEEMDLLKEFPVSLYAINKCDLGAALSEDAIIKLSGADRVVKISALTGEGIDDLRHAVHKMIVAESSAGIEDAIITNERHYSALEHALAALRQARQDLAAGFTEEVALANLHQALRSLGVITGETLIADIINQIFSTFCIGK
ncbi:MAG TPA: tRNA uridine-5-carboxymethylaminomethyl(34) synthesis GTPase MnmE [Blastocatellia bacterium]|nr:tRNA uridine-5-carboxymethylaminomethyl(34) synthesis GTPase MnmE [Blastocatellia bacterium]